jgi:hypothetical protein
VTAGHRQALKCKARRTSGEPCKGYAVKGALVCYAHGGASPRARNAAAMKLAEDKARKLLIKMGVTPPVVNSLEELQRVAGEVVAWKDACAEMINKLHEEEVALRYESSQHLEQVRTEVLLWERSLDRAVATLSALARLNLDQRLVGIKEKTAEMISAALASSLAKGGIDTEAANIVRREFSKRLKLVEAA